MTGCYPHTHGIFINDSPLSNKAVSLDQAKARRQLAGYYAHFAALDHCVGQIESTLDELNLLDNTILVFTSDHGDLLRSQGKDKKQRPWNESIMVPLSMAA